MIIKDILHEDSDGEYVQVNEVDSVFSVLREMADLNVGAVVVKSHDNNIVGVFSERDYARKIVLEEKSSRFTEVKDVMVSKIVYVTSDFTLEECLSILTHMGIRDLPVIEGSRLVALLSMDRIVKKLISEQKFLIDQLTRYITGSPLFFTVDKNKPLEGHKQQEIQCREKLLY